MWIIKLAALWVFTWIVMFFAFIIVIVPIAASSQAAGAAAGVLAIDASEQALNDIPPILLELYIVAADVCPGLPWTVIAGIGKVESDHGRFGGATIAPDGKVSPPIVGIALNGENNTARIDDTDDGILDGDSVFDRAVDTV